MFTRGGRSGYTRTAILKRYASWPTKYLNIMIFIHFSFIHLISSVAEHATALGIEPNEYRIICRNGTLADRTGFDVEQECALTTIVDGEIVVARNNRKTTGIINALSSYDKYFQSDPDFKMYNSFAGQRDLLFKVSGRTPMDM